MDRKLFKNIISLFGVQGMNYIIPLITLPYLVRVLGPSGYGELGFSLALVQYACLITDYGFNLSATKQIAILQENKIEISRVFWSVIFSKCIMGICSFIIFYLLMISVDKISNVSSVVLAGMTMVIGNIIFPGWLFQGKEKMALMAFVNVLSRLSTVPLIFLFVKDTGDAYMAAFISGITTVVAGIVACVLIVKNKWLIWLKPTLGDIKNTMEGGWHLFMSSASVSLYTTSTTIILGFICGPNSVGYYVAADKLRQAVQGLISPVTQSFFPRINSEMKKNVARGMELVRWLLKYQGLGSLTLSVLLFILSPLLITMVYGEEYSQSKQVLMVLAWLPFIVGLSNVLGIQTLLVLGFKTEFSYVLLSAAIINICSIMPLTYFYAEIGAATSVLMTESIVTILMFCVIRKNKIPLFEVKK